MPYIFLSVDWMGNNSMKIEIRLDFHSKNYLNTSFKFNLIKFSFYFIRVYQKGLFNFLTNRHWLVFLNQTSL